MSKLKLTLTEDQLEQAKNHNAVWNLTVISEDLNQTREEFISPLTLEFDIPSPWRTDIENAPRDRPILALINYTTNGKLYPETIQYAYGKWKVGCDNIFQSEITHWMEIPKLPEA